MSVNFDFERKKLCFLQDIPCSYRSRHALLDLDWKGSFESGLAKCPCEKLCEFSNFQEFSFCCL